MAQFAGIWGPSRLDGPVSLVVGSTEYLIPAGSEVRRVSSRLGEVVHVRVGQYVHVFTEQGKLEETMEESARRARPDEWQAIPHEVVGHGRRRRTEIENG